MFDDLMPHARMFSAIHQYGRAVHLLKLDLLLKYSSFESAAAIADAYFQEWVHTGWHSLYYGCQHLFLKVHKFRHVVFESR